MLCSDELAEFIRRQKERKWVSGWKNMPADISIPGDFCLVSKTYGKQLRDKAQDLA